MSDTTNLDHSSMPASGRFVLRLDPGVHAALRRAAKELDLSLNEYCARKLVLPGAPPGSPLAEAVGRAAEVVGGALVGVVAFGSWARGKMAAGSDVDLLIVLDDTIPLARRLYREWDRSPVRWRGHVVEPHFAHLPPAGARPSGIWADVAVDGVVLFERGFAVSRRLVEFRTRIAEGLVVRRRAGGQSYWVEAA